MINDNGTTATRWGIGVVILFALTLALYLGKPIFIPTVIALLLAAMLWPMSTWLHQAGIPLFKLRRRLGFPWFTTEPARWRMSWGLSTMTVLTLLVVVILMMTLSFSVGISKIFIDIGNESKQRELYRSIRHKLRHMGVDVDNEYLGRNVRDAEGNELRDKEGKLVDPDPQTSDLFKTIQGFFDINSPTFKNLILGVGGYSLAILWEAILVLFILLFLLLEGRMLSRRLVELFGPHAAVQGKAVEALKEMAVQVRAYLVWRTIINFAMAIILGMLYQFLGLKLAWSWALLTAVLWYIPYLGPIAAGIPPIIDAFVSAGSPWVAVFILGFYIFWVVIEGYYVVPVIMGRSMEMNATTVMLACLYWERVWGATGLFLAMPLIAALKAVCTHVPEWKPWANLMSSHDDEPAPPSSSSHDDSHRNGETQVVPRPSDIVTGHVPEDGHMRPPT